MRHSAWLDRARAAIVGRCENDFSARVARQNLEIGLAKIFCAGARLERDVDATFYLSRDFTITKNPLRWSAGFAYGGLLELRASKPIVIMDVRPNTCGTLLGRLPANYNADDFVECVSAERESRGGSEWDYGRRNHFVNLYRFNSTGRFGFVIHGCLSSNKHDSASGPGLYIDKSEYWKRHAHQVSTEFGDLSVLVDDKAVDYCRLYREKELLTKRDRLETASRIFGEFEAVSNETHEGLLDEHRYLLGCHAPSALEQSFPLLTDFSKPSYIVAAPPVTDPLLPDNILALVPHGLGYDLPFEGTIDIQFSSAGRIVVLKSRSLVDAGGTIYFRDFANTPFSFRATELADRWEESGNYRIVDTLLPVAFVKF